MHQHSSINNPSASSSIHHQQINFSLPTKPLYSSSSSTNFIPKISQNSKIHMKNAHKKRNGPKINRNNTTYNKNIYPQQQQNNHQLFTQQQQNTQQFNKHYQQQQQNNQQFYNHQQQQQQNNHQFYNQENFMNNSWSPTPLMSIGFPPTTINYVKDSKFYFG
uniref:Uncharacterized protein n=1 Tax=Meloidogyne enterolobii TaxID=390850 RepID=A0A6V7WJQ2_MELEN|nr:unnamed protein product [Meloidogyne enterolobii]